MKEFKIYFFGDSICFGQYVSIHKSFVSIVSSKIDELFQNKEIQPIVQNPSISGNTTRQALERMAFDVHSHKPDIVFVQFGLNDCNYWQTDSGVQRVTPKAFAANINEIIQRCLAVGAKRVIVNTNHPTTRDEDIMPGAGITYQQSNEQYSQILREVVCEIDDARVILNDMEKSIRDYTDNNRDKIADLILPKPDLLHLSEEGHQVYADHLIAFITDIIDGLSS